MSNSFWVFSLLILSLLPGSPLPVIADEAVEIEDTKKPEEEEKKKPRYRLLPIPIIVTEPAIGKGLGVALALFHPPKTGKEDDTRLASLESAAEFSTPRSAPPVVTGVAGAYTSSKSWFGGVGHTNNWRNDSIRYTGALARAKVNSKVYISSLPLDFSMETTIIYQELKFRIRQSDFLLGGGISYMKADNQFGIGAPEEGDGRFAINFHNIGVAFKAAYETRDNTMNPRSGQLFDLSLWRYDEAIGGDYDYWSAKFKALSFHPLSEKLTLGLRLDFSTVEGRVPFFAVPYVKLRGIPALRYQNKSAGAFEVEGRYLIKPRWEVSAFAGLGYTSDHFTIYDNPDSIYNFGMGGRYNIFEAHNVWVGIDIARGPEDWNWYVQVGHPW